MARLSSEREPVPPDGLPHSPYARPEGPDPEVKAERARRDRQDLAGVLLAVSSLSLGGGVFALGFPLLVEGAGLWPHIAAGFGLAVVGVAMWLAQRRGR